VKDQPQKIEIIKKRCVIITFYKNMKFFVKETINIQSNDDDVYEHLYVINLSMVNQREEKWCNRWNHKKIPFFCP
jgi:hypothetical protein